MPDNSNQSFDRTVRPISNQVDLVRQSRIVDEVMTRANQPWTTNGQGWNPIVDEVWAGSPKGNHPSNYFDYYFSGQDIRVIMEGANEEAEYADIPIVQIAWNIEQKKSPVFGFWSFTWDHCALGTRMVSGNLIIPVKYVGYFRDLLKAAARSRKKKVYPYTRPLTTDDANIEKYWYNNIDPFNSVNSEPNIYSTHPPFNLEILYGVQNISLASISSSSKARELYQLYADDNALLEDTNERLVESDNIAHKNRIVLDACQIMSMSQAISPSGEPILEQYQFIARDMIEL